MRPVAGVCQGAPTVCQRDDCKWVAHKFEISRRRENLSFSHHAEVTALEPAEQDDWLDRAEAEKWARRLPGRPPAGRLHFCDAEFFQRGNMM